MNDTDTQNIQYAGFWRRFLATLIDSLIIMVIIVPILLSIYDDAYLYSDAVIQGPADFFIGYLLPAIAVILFWVYKSATPGKMVISAKICDARSGGRPSTGQCIGRYLAYIISTLPLCLGFIWVAFDKRKQGWHDKIAGTVVVCRSIDPEPVRFEQTADTD